MKKVTPWSYLKMPRNKKQLHEMIHQAKQASAIETYSRATKEEQQAAASKVVRMDRDAERQAVIAITEMAKNLSSLAESLSRSVLGFQHNL